MRLRPLHRVRLLVRVAKSVAPFPRIWLGESPSRISAALELLPGTVALPFFNHCNSSPWRLPRFTVGRRPRGPRYAARTLVPWPGSSGEMVSRVLV
jgi:hypothetical protein